MKRRKIKKQFRTKVYTIISLAAIDTVLLFVLGIVSLLPAQPQKGQTLLASAVKNAICISDVVYAEEPDVEQPVYKANTKFEVSQPLEAEKTAEDETNVDIEAGAEDAVYSTLYGDFTKEEMELLWAVVMQEGGERYENAQAVMSTVINRLNDPHWAWCGDTVMEQITYPQQYCYSIDDYWVKYLGGNVGDGVKTAVIDVLNGNVSHGYTCFRGYYVEGAENIGDNYFWYGY